MSLGHCHGHCRRYPVSKWLCHGHCRRYPVSKWLFVTFSFFLTVILRALKCEWLEVLKDRPGRPLQANVVNPSWKRALVHEARNEPIFSVGLSAAIIPRFFEILWSLAHLQKGNCPLQQESGFASLYVQFVRRRTYVSYGVSIRRTSIVQFEKLFENSQNRGEC